MTDFGVCLIVQKVYLIGQKVYLIVQKACLIGTNPWGKCNDLIYIINLNYVNREGEFSLAVGSFKHPLKDKPKSKPFSYGINTEHPPVLARCDTRSLCGKRKSNSSLALYGSLVRGTFSIVEYSLEKMLILVGSQPTGR
jgi:hypothetical protein